MRGLEGGSGRKQMRRFWRVSAVLIRFPVGRVVDVRLAANVQSTFTEQASDDSRGCREETGSVCSE
jgi:hypothetical protein